MTDAGVEMDREDDPDEEICVEPWGPEAAAVPADLLRTMGKMGLSAGEQCFVLQFLAMPQSGIPSDWTELENVAARMGTSLSTVFALVEGLKKKGLWSDADGYLASNPIFKKAAELIKAEKGESHAKK